jgi:hypothetical protein
LFFKITAIYTACLIIGGIVGVGIVGVGIKVGIIGVGIKIVIVAVDIIVSIFVGIIIFWSPDCSSRDK